MTKELTNLEICQKIAEIEKPDNLEYDHQGYPMIKVQSIAEYVDYNPLSDDALCFQLMIKYRVDLSFYETLFKASVLEFTLPIRKTESVSDSPNKAICMAIIKAKEIGFLK